MFQKAILDRYIDSLDELKVSEAFSKLSDFFESIENVKKSKEEQYQSEFLNDFFIKALGYTLYPKKEHNLITEYKNQSDSKKADGAIIKDGKPIAIIELKSTKTKSMDLIVNQAFNYKHNHPTCNYVITSNFEKLRIYIEHSNEYIEFNLFDLTFERFKLFYLLLSKDNLLNDLPKKIKEQSKEIQADITNKFYKEYSSLRISLFENLKLKNSNINELELLRLTQKLLDRYIFIFFAEDKFIIDNKTTKNLLELYKNDIEDRELYHFVKIVFKAVDIGNERLKIDAYNGGLFREDKILDSLNISSDILEQILNLSSYDFSSEIDVNILGHIFENSLSDLEEIRANILDEKLDKTKSKRKKDGVFYTPEYITHYIVENTLGKICNEKKEELELTNLDIKPPKNYKKPTKKELDLKDRLANYREYLLNLTILDPACGSGAFLNQAFNYLIKEHDFITENEKILFGGGLIAFTDIDTQILEKNLFGVDINDEAIEIARLSLWLKTARKGRKLTNLSSNIKVGNSLIDDKEVDSKAFKWEEEFKEVFLNGGFDVVIGNPPYVRNTSLKNTHKTFYNKKYFTAYKQFDLYILFNELAIKVSKTNSFIGFIQPNKFLSSDYGLYLLNFLFNNANFKFIKNVSFENVFLDASVYPYIFIYQKKDLKENFDIKSLNLFNICNINVLVGFENEIKSNEIINKIVNKSLKLEDISVDIKRGVPNNKITFPNKSAYKAISSTDLNLPFYMNYRNLQINYINEKYEKEKVQEFNKKLILLPRTVLSIRAILSQENYHILDRIYYVKLNKNKKYDLKFVLSLLNSKIITFFYNYFYGNTKIGGGYFDLKGNQLKQLPIPKIEEKEQQPFIDRADSMLELNEQFNKLKNEFLNEVKNHYTLEKLSKKLQSFYTLSFDDFTKEIAKATKIKFKSAKEKKEFKNYWFELFDDESKTLLELQKTIDKTDEEIDNLVYKLYDLTTEEIEIIEESLVIDF